MAAEPVPPKPISSTDLSPGTARSYAAIWELFTDWCDVTGQVPLPADPTTVLDFLTECPAAPATRRRRVIAIDHRHTAAGLAPPGADPRVRAAIGRPPTEPAPIAAEVRARVDAALRALPSRGWTGGLFGQRDRCLLVLSQFARIPHRQLARLTAGDITVAGGVATIAVAGRTWTVQAMDDPVLCGPCAVARWLHTHHVIVTRIATRVVADHLDDDTQTVTSSSPHACIREFTATGGAEGSPLLATSDQWGHTPFPPTAMSRLAVSRQARDLIDGIITVHRELPVHRVDPTVDVTPRNYPETTRPAYGLAQHRAALDRRRADITGLADVAAELDAVDQRAVELNRRITELLDLAIPP
jgi:hypothetical protein